MLKQTEETIVFFVTFLSLVAFQLGETLVPCPPPLATPMYSTVSLHRTFIVNVNPLFSALINAS